MKSDKANCHSVAGHPDAVVWESKDEPGVFYLTNSRGNNRSTRQLEAKKILDALKEANDYLA